MINLRNKFITTVITKKSFIDYHISKIKKRNIAILNVVQFMSFPLCGLEEDFSKEFLK